MNSHATFKVVQPTSGDGWKFIAAEYQQTGRSNEVDFGLTAPSGKDIDVSQYAPRTGRPSSPPTGQIRIHNVVWTLYGDTNWFRTLPGGTNIMISGRDGEQHEIERLAEKYS